MAFTTEQIAQWTKEGHWPPPEGTIFLPHVEASQDGVDLLFSQLLNTLSQNDAEWWEKCSPLEFLAQFVTNPLVVLRQIGVACDMQQVPLGSDQETYPTLLPKKASILIKQYGAIDASPWQPVVQPGYSIT